MFKIDNKFFIILFCFILLCYTSFIKITYYNDESFITCILRFITTSKNLEYVFKIKNREKKC